MSKIAPILMKRTSNYLHKQRDSEKEYFLYLRPEMLMCSPLTLRTNLLKTDIKLSIVVGILV